MVRQFCIPTCERCSAHDAAERLPGQSANSLRDNARCPRSQTSARSRATRWGPPAADGLLLLAARHGECVSCKRGLLLTDGLTKTRTVSRRLSPGAPTHQNNKYAPARETIAGVVAVPPGCNHNGCLPTPPQGSEVSTLVLPTSTALRGILQLHRRTIHLLPHQHEGFPDYAPRTGFPNTQNSMPGTTPLGS
jgi:hypothetical protein